MLRRDSAISGPVVRRDSAIEGPVVRRRSSVPQMSQHGGYELQRDWESKSPVKARGLKFLSYGGDIFHTMVNQPWWRMVVLVFSLYLISWSFWALIGHMFFPRLCIGGDATKEETFVQWLNWTIQSMSTIGYGQLVPTCLYTEIMLPCMMINGFVLDACTCGFVFAKFAAPTKRGNTLLFSSRMVGSLHMTTSGALDLMLSFRLVNTRKHPVTQPEVCVYLVDHAPLDMPIPKPPRFHKLPVATEPPITFVEYPCTVTCRFSTPPLNDGDLSPVFCSFTSAVHTAPACDVDTPLHDLLRSFAASGATSESWPKDCDMQLLDSLSLVVLFSAQEPSVGAAFEIRRSYPLVDTAWGCAFSSMLSGRLPRRVGESVVGPRAVLDLSSLDDVVPLEGQGASASARSVGMDD